MSELSINIFGDICISLGTGDLQGLLSEVLQGDVEKEVKKDSRNSETEISEIRISFVRTPVRHAGKERLITDGTNVRGKDGDNEGV